jgi:hypothetical protein
MKTVQPPRLAVVLLEHFAADNEPLVGDLLEEFGVRQSRTWFWRQVLYALLTGSFRHHDARPLRLLEEHASLDFAPLHPRTLPPAPINLSASPIPDIGGLGLVALGSLVAVVRPEVVWLALPTIAAGVLLGIILVLIRRRSGPNARIRRKVTAALT